MLLTPTMQSELDAIVFASPARMSKAAKQQKFVMPPSVPASVRSACYDPVAASSSSCSLVNIAAAAAAAHGPGDHFGPGNAGTDLDALGENTTRLGRQKETGTMEYMSDRAVSFDPVYGTAHEGFDTASHFADFGMALTKSDGSAAAAHEEMLQRKSEASAEVRRQVLAEPEPLPEPKLMGHEGLDSASNFVGGMELRRGASGKHTLRPTLDHVSHFAGGAMAFADGGSVGAEATKQVGQYTRSESGHVRVWDGQGGATLQTPPKTPEKAAARPSSAGERPMLASAMSYGAGISHKVAPQQRLFEPYALPDFSSAASPASPAYRERLKTLPRYSAERETSILAAKQARSALPAAGTPSSFRDLRLAEIALNKERPIRSPPARDPMGPRQGPRLTYASPHAHRPSPIRAPPSPPQHGHGVCRPAWWG